MNRCFTNKACAAMALCVTFAIATPQAAVADGILRDGMGAISTGRGGTNLGFADNGNLIVDNPGALANVYGRGLNEIGIDLLFTDLSYSDPDNPKTSASNNPFPVGQISFIRKSEDGNFAWGFGAFSQAGFSTQYELNGPFPFSGPQNYKSIGAMMRILPAASVVLTPRCTVGATLGVAVSHTELEGPYFTQFPTPVQGTPTKLDLQGTGAGLSWSVGMQYLLSPRTIFGASFQGETHIDADGSTSLDIPGLGVSRFDSTLSTQWPSILAMGISHQVDSRNMVAIDVLWTRWSEAKQNYDLLLTNPSNPAFGAILGPVFPERFPLQWRDSVAVRLGYEHLLYNGHLFRAGYVYHPNPIPAGTLSPFIQSIVEHSVSLGYGWRAGSYGIDLGYQFMFGPDQSVGTSDFVGGDFDQSTSFASAHWLLMSAVRYF